MPANLPALVNADGTPMRAAAPTAQQLKSEVAAAHVMGVRSIISGHPAQGLTPGRIAALLRGAEQGDTVAYLELAEEMEEKDPHYLSVLGTRKRQVAQLPIEVEPASGSAEDKADADLVRGWLDRDMLEAELFDILDAIGKGFSATEIVWNLTGGTWLPERMLWRDPRWFEFDRVDGETLMQREIGPSVPLLPFKFIVHRHAAKSGLSIRGGLARVVAWGYLFKNYAVKDWVSFLETYGMPMRVGRYDNGESAENRRVLMRALSDLGTDAAAMFPKTMDIEFVDQKGGSTPNDLWRALAEYVDLQVSKAVLGQTNTTEAQASGLGSGQANVHNDVRGDIERADAKLLAATLNEQLVKPIVMLNRGARARYPRLKIGRPEAVDVEALTKAVQVLVPLGVEVSADDMREAAGLPVPRPGARMLAPAEIKPVEAPGAPDGPKLPGAPSPDPLVGSLPPKSALPEATGAAASQVGDATDAIYATVDEMLTDWEQLVTPILRPVEQLVRDATSLAAVRDGLIATIAAMDATELTELLAKGLFGAKLAGDVAARPVGDA